jgi:hypothetical protein
VDKKTSHHHASTVEQDLYHLDSVFGSNTSQEQLYHGIAGVDKHLIQSVLDIMETNTKRLTPYQQTVGSNYADVATNANHLLISLGVSNSGKTHSLFGSSFSQSNTHQIGLKDGLVQRLVEDLFTIGSNRIQTFNHSVQRHVSSRRSRSNHELPSMEIALQLSMVYVYHDQVYDMLTHYHDQYTESGHKHNAKQDSMNQLRITQHPETKDFVAHPIIVTSKSMQDACDVISYGLQQGHTAPTFLNEGSSRGHTLITIRPVSIIDSSLVVQGGAISVLDMAGIERQTSVNKYPTPTEMKTSISINSSISTLLQCLRALKLKYCTTESDNNDLCATECKIGSCSKDATEYSATPLKETSQNQEHFLSPKSLLRRRFAQSPALVKLDENQCEKNDSIKADARNANNGQKSKLISKPNQISMIPFRDNKLTMLLQPLLTGDASNYMNTDQSPPVNPGFLVQTSVTLIVFAYPGVKDYNEKKFLLGEVDSLGDLTWSKENITVGKSIVDQQSNTSSIHNRLRESGNSDENKDTSSSKHSKEDSSYWTKIVKNLEEENEKLKGNVDALTRQCYELKEKNEDLKRTLDLHLCKSVNSSKTNNEKIDEMEFLESRDARRKLQTLLPSPLRDHMQNVEQHRMIETGTVRHTQLSHNLSFPLTVDLGRKRIRVTDRSRNNDDTELWKYLSHES